MRDLEALLRLGRWLDQHPEAMVPTARELLWVRDRQGHICRLEANPAQQAFEARRGRENIVLKARQMGMSTWIAGRFFLKTITRPGTLTLQVAHTREAAESLLSLVRRMWTELPEELRDGPLRLRRANAGQLVFGEIDSEIRVASAADVNAGRGLSVQQLHCSEVSRWPGNAGETLAGLRAALAPDGELVLESTPSGAYGAFYEAWTSGADFGGTSAAPEARTRANQGEACGYPSGSVMDGRAPGRLVRHFLPWWMEALYVGPRVPREAWTAEELGLVGRYGLSEVQIGFRRGLEQRFGTLRSQEFAEDAESCFRATGSCCFEVDALERRLAAVPEPLLRRRNGALRLWLPPVVGKEYLLGVDTAGGGADGDFAAVQVLEMATGLQCAELQERLRPAELAQVCAELGREYGGALVAVERNNHGSAVLAFLETEQHYRRVYAQHGQAGWLTSAASKPEMIARLGTLLVGSPERFMSRWFLGECRSFVTEEGGRSGAAPGAHDDLVMSMAIAQTVRAELLAGGVAARAGVPVHTDRGREVCIGADFEAAQKHDCGCAPSAFR